MHLSDHGAGGVLLLHSQDQIGDYRAAATPPTQIEWPCWVMALSGYTRDCAAQNSLRQKHSQVVTLQARMRYSKRVSLGTNHYDRHELQQERLRVWIGRSDHCSGGRS